MTRKTWPLLLGSFVIPALLIAACSADTEDDDDDDGADAGNANSTSTGATRNTGTTRIGGGNTTSTGTGRFGTGARSNAGGVLNRGGASLGGRSNQFNTAGAVAKAGSGNANLAGSAGKPPGIAGGAGVDSGSGGATSTSTAAATGGNANGGTTSGVAGAAGASAICPDGCAVVGLTLGTNAVVDYVLEMSSTVNYSNDSLTLTAGLYAPGAQSGRVRLVIQNDTGDDCTSTWTNLGDLGSGFVPITKDLTGCDVTQASVFGIRIANNSGSEKTYSLYVNSLTLASTDPQKNVAWTPASASDIDAAGPDVGVLGPITPVAGATLTYLND